MRKFAMLPLNFLNKKLFWSSSTSLRQSQITDAEKQVLSKRNVIFFLSNVTLLYGADSRVYDNEHFIVQILTSGISNL